VIGPERWSQDAERWLKDLVWDAEPQNKGETILAFDQETNALVGYVTWRFRREAVLDSEAKRWSVEIFFLGVAAGRHREGIGTVLFETALEDANNAMKKRSGKKQAKGPMPTLIDAEVPNELARRIYKEHWGFRHRRIRVSKSGREYEEMWRPPPAAIESDADAPQVVPA
jgi:ribosomal protein S18 acetylase RimI-like enzyme